MKILLLGYMASGKSYIGAKIADILEFQFIDLDKYIEEKEALSISKIFSQKGEIYFRNIESQYLKEILLLNHNCVIALGGGTPCYANNIDAISNVPNIKSIYLKMSLSNLAERLFEFKESRPLIAHISTKDDMLEFVGKHLFERSHFYNQADITINADVTEREIIESIMLALF